MKPRPFFYDRKKHGLRNQKQKAEASPIWIVMLRKEKAPFRFTYIITQS